MRLRTDWRSLQNRIAGNLVAILREIAEQCDRDEVQHDRVDDFVRSEPGFKHAGNSAPDRAGGDRGDATQGHQHDRRQMKEWCDGRVPWVLRPEFESNPGRRKGRYVKLTLGADV